MTERGASLPEVSMVVGIFGLVMVFAGEGFVAAASRHRERSVVTEIAAELRAARHTALERRQRVRVVFEAPAVHLRMELPEESNRVFRESSYGGKGVILESLSNGPAVTFFPSGRSASPTTITFQGTSQERWKITVSLTGRISIQS